jgi:hypothetical protein
MRRCRQLAGGIVLGLIVAGTVGCGFWRSSPDPATAEAEQARKAKEKPKAKPKEDFERLQAAMLPDNEPSSARDRPPLLVKPGHWVALSETWVAHHTDLAGELTSFVEERGRPQPQPLESFPARIWPRFPAVLPKEQPKRIETLLYVPPRPQEDVSLAQGPALVALIRSELRRRGERMPLAAASTLVRMMQEHEQLLVVLTGGNVAPSAYAHLDQLPSVYVSEVEGPRGAVLRHYHVIRPKIARSVPLPAHSLAWTTISHVIWDGLDPGLFSTPQQEALLDWLHWGGQLVISGPDSLEKLRGSFLAPYLPGEADGTVQLDEAAFAELNQHFSLPPPATRGRAVPTKGEAVRQIRILPAQPMVGIALRPHPAAAPVAGTGRLVWERRVGGGRTAVVCFPLTDPRIKSWKNLDGFVNSVLLRRPGREFRLSDAGTVEVAWRREFFDRLLREDPWGARSYAASSQPLAESLVWDPRLNSTVRFLARDLLAEDGGGLPLEVGRRNWGSGDDLPAPGAGRFFGGGPPWLRRVPQVSTDVLLSAERLSDWHYGGYGWRPARTLEERPGGVGSWTEASSVGRAAGEALIAAAGITIPKADFVWKVMAVYLVILVPLNALVFWLLGRLEWAWAAVPLIAVGAAVAVVRMAQLDIGFSRSRTEVALLELQGNYPRGHLTRFTALYSSLSTRYALTFEPAHAVVQPYDVRLRSTGPALLRHVADLDLTREQALTLHDVPVASNSTAIIHSEQFLPLGRDGSGPGSLQVRRDAAGAWTLTNDTLLDLREVGLFRLPTPQENQLAGHRGEEAVQVAYLPRLAPGTQTTLTWVPHRRPRRTGGQPALEELPARSIELPALWLAEWEASSVLGLAGSDDPQTRRDAAARRRLTELAVVVLRDLKLLPGDVRLIAWTDQHLPGLTIRPQASQNQTQTLIVAHLARGPLPPPLPDANRLEDLVPASEAQEADEPALPPSPAEKVR